MPGRWGPDEVQQQTIMYRRGCRFKDAALGTSFACRAASSSLQEIT